MARDDHGQRSLQAPATRGGASAKQHGRRSLQAPATRGGASVELIFRETFLALRCARNAWSTTDTLDHIGAAKV